MNATLFSRFRNVIYDHSGINLVEGKQVLLQSRISKRMRTLGIENEEVYLDQVIADPSGEEMVLLLDAISTNVTYFFRETDHFDLLRNALNDWLSAGQSRFRIWSAACSTGQEPYTIGMTALDCLRQAALRGVDLRILATDISTRALEAAMEGEYAEREVDRVSLDHRNRYLQSVKTSGNIHYRVGDELRRLLTFRRLNLSQPPFPMRGPLDAVFCRNVMIYFDNQVRARLVGEIARLLKPGGLLFIGHAESLLGVNAGLQTVAPSVYKKRP